MKKFHEPVLLQESLNLLNVAKSKKYIDATLGGGRHALEIIKRGGIVLGIDVDEEAIRYVSENFQFQIANSKLKIAQGNFKDINIIAKENGFDSVAGAFFDLGVSSHQLETQERGFSFQNNGPLDMRMDKGLAATAADLVNGLTRKELYELFITLGQEHNAWPIVNSIIRARRIKPIQSTGELAQIVTKSVPRYGKIHPATKIFQALRMAVNDELGNLRAGLSSAIQLLDSRGRLVVISFHSLEDRIVKNLFKEFKDKDLGVILTVKPVTPSLEEVKNNPRSRSAKLRAIEKN